MSEQASSARVYKRWGGYPVYLGILACALGGCSIVLAGATAQSYFAAPIPQQATPAPTPSPAGNGATPTPEPGAGDPTQTPSPVARLPQISSFSQLPALYSTRVDAVAAAGAQVAIAQWSSDVAASVDGGRTFQPTTLPPGSYLTDEIPLKSDGADIYTVASIEGVERVLRLSGAQWVLDSDAPAGEGQNRLLLAADGGSIAALTTGAVFRRSAGGWSKIDATLPREVGFDTPPDLDGERLYIVIPVGGGKLALYGMDLAASTPSWVQVGKLLEVLGDDGPILRPGRFAVYDGFAYVVSNNQFFALELASQTGEWKADLAASAASWVGKVGTRLYRSLGSNLQIFANQEWTAQGYLEHSAPSGVAVSGSRLLVGTEGGLMQKGLDDWDARFEATALDAYSADAWVGTNGGTLYVASADFPGVLSLGAQGDGWLPLKFGVSPAKGFSFVGGTMFVGSLDADWQSDRIGRGGDWIEVMPKQRESAPGYRQEFAGVSGDRVYLVTEDFGGAVAVFSHDLSPAGPWIQAAPPLAFGYQDRGDVAVAGGQIFACSRSIGNSKIMACLNPGDGGSWAQIDAPEPKPSAGTFRLAAAGDALFLVVTDYDRPWRIYRFDRESRSFTRTGDGLDFIVSFGFTRPVTDGTDLYLSGTVNKEGPPWRWAIRRVPLAGGQAEPYGPELSADVRSLAIDRVGKRLFVGTVDGVLVGR